MPEARRVWIWVLESVSDFEQVGAVVIPGQDIHLHSFPAVGAEEKMNDMVIHLNVALEVSIDHLPNWG